MQQTTRSYEAHEHRQYSVCVIVVSGQVVCCVVSQSFALCCSRVQALQPKSCDEAWQQFCLFQCWNPGVELSMLGPVCGVVC